MRFVDVKNDIAFRKIFGNENRKEILISFLNATLDLPKGKRIKKVKLRNAILPPETKGVKYSMLDILVTDERNVHYIVEMQVEEPKGFDKRVQYYTAKEYAKQIELGVDYPKLNQVIFIGILNFNFFKGHDFLTQHLIINRQTGEQELKDLEFNFIELKKFKKNEKELITLIDKWVYFIKNAPDLKVIPENVDDDGLLKAYEDAERFNWTRDELSYYDIAGMRQQDEKGVLELAVERAEEKGIKIGEEKGIKIGEKRLVLKIAKEMMRQGIDKFIIQKTTQLSMKIIEALIKENS